MPGNSQTKTKTNTKKKKDFPITAQAIDKVIANYTSHSIEELRRSLTDCKLSIDRMRLQIRKSPTPLPSTEKALIHWESRAKTLEQLISNKIKKDGDLSVILTGSNNKISMSHTNNNWTQAFVEAALEILPPQLFGRIYQEVPNYSEQRRKNL